MSYVPFITALAQSSPEQGRALRRLLNDLPTDPASVFVLLLSLISVGLVLWFGRSKGSGPGENR